MFLFIAGKSWRALPWRQFHYFTKRKKRKIEKIKKDWVVFKPTYKFVKGLHKDFWQKIFRKFYRKLLEHASRNRISEAESRELWRMGARPKPSVRVWEAEIEIESWAARFRLQRNAEIDLSFSLDRLGNWRFSHLPRRRNLGLRSGWTTILGRLRYLTPPCWSTPGRPAKKSKVEAKLVQPRRHLTIFLY